MLGCHGTTVARFPCPSTSCCREPASPGRRPRPPRPKLQAREPGGKEAQGNPTTGGSAATPPGAPTRSPLPTAARSTARLARATDLRRGLRATRIAAGAVGSRDPAAREWAPPEGERGADRPETHARGRGRPSGGTAGKFHQLRRWQRPEGRAHAARPREAGPPDCGDAEGLSPRALTKMPLET